MSKYSCERCGKDFSQKSHYDSHKRRKKPCENYSNKIQTMVDKKVKETINDLNFKKLILKNEETINQTYNNMETFKELYEFIQKCEEVNIIKWLEQPWVGKDKQESLLRLFAGLRLIDKLKLYDICKGNYNKKTIIKHTNIKDVFYNQEDNLINLKDKGDSSDLTGICKENEKHLLVTTSKNLNKTQVGKLDIDKILTNFEQYNVDGYTMSLCICVRNNTDFQNMKKNIEESNQQLKLLLEKEDTIIIDWNDLNQAYHQFKMFYGHTPLDNIINSNKTALCLKMHQHLGVSKTLRMKNSEKKKILWGHIQRSGKSYIIGGCIIEDSKDKDECNYLVITTAPNETIEQQRKVFDCIELKDFNIIILNGKNKKPVLTNKNIIICSKQFLQTKIDKGHDKQKPTEEKTKSIAWLKKMTFDMRFIDESHNGGTTELAKKTLEFYGKQAFTVQITATYSKPINDYNIPKECWILWDLEDIKLCKNITNEGSIIRLVEKHGDCIQNIISKYSQDSIISEYSKYPELWLLTDEINPDVVSEIINDTQDNNYGWSPDACFLLKQAIKKDVVIKEEFQNEGENLKLWYRIFGKKNKFGIPDKDYPDDIVFMKRIEKICKDPTIDSRFIGEGDFHNEPMIIMAFLPQNNIDKISKATIKLLERNNVIPDYEIISINSKTTNNPKQSIEDARIKARNSGKKGVLVLSGKQCSLGVSIDNCDIVLLLNNSMGFDMIYQMMFRCMTEGKNKKCGFVVDLNIHRVIETSVINYASLIKPDIHPSEATKFILQERLINLNGDHWMPSFGNDVSKITALCENVYKLYSSNTENALNHFLNRLRFKEILLTKEEQKIFNAMFSDTTPTKKQKELIDKLLEEDEEEEKIKKGIEKTKVDNEDIDTSSETSNDNDKKEEKQVNYMDILKHIIPLICLLTIHDKETSFVEMFELIENDEYVYNILIDQTKSWWGKSIDSKIIKKFINVYMKYMKGDKETNQIIRTVKELFMKNIKNNRELSMLIDKYLIPQELEKKSNAEVSTPFKLRQEMLDKIPVEFWTSIKKVFEPCAGKGGFIVDIIDRFMNGLEKTIPDEKERYRTIVEECLYFSDINSTNIFVCKLLIDPYNEYNLNYNEGNTLELNIKEKWNIEGFDAVIGNPPYEAQKATGDNKLYLDFTSYSIKNIYDNALLLFIVPTNIKNYITNQDKNRSYISNFMEIMYLSLNTSNKYFPNISTYFSYFLIKKNIVKSCQTKTAFMRGKKIENSIITINEKDELPLTLSTKDINLINKVSNLIKKQWNTLDIKKALYQKTNKKECTQRIRKSHIKNGDIKEDYDETYKYKIIDKINKGHNFPGIYYYNNYKMLDYGKPKIIMCSGGYLMPSLDKEGVYNISDNMLYILINDLSEYEGLTILINSLLIKYLNKVTMTDNIHGRDLVIKNIKNITLSNIKCENDIYSQLNITKDELELIKNTIN
jgi:hypothetical protein